MKDKLKKLNIFNNPYEPWMAILGLIMLAGIIYVLF